MRKLVTAGAAVIVAACVAGVAALPASAEVSSIAYQGRTSDGFVFTDVDRTVSDPSQAFFVPYENNPVIPGRNLYAPSPVKVGNTWYVYYGGWDSPNDSEDDVFLRTTTDSTFRTFSAPIKVVADGIYIHANDPSVIKNGSTWVMALTTADPTDYCSILTSTDGVTWPTLSTRSAEIVWSGTAPTTCARPSLNYNSTTSQWEMYFDGTVGGVYAQWLATSSQATPTTFSVEKNVGQFADADIKRLANGTYIAAYRTTTPTDPWFIEQSTSADGRNFTHKGTLIQQSPLKSYDDCGVTNPGWAFDGSTIVALLYGGTDTCFKASHDIGVAYPQAAVTALSGTQSHELAEAISPTSSFLSTFQFNQIDQISAKSGPTASPVDLSLPNPATTGTVWSVNGRVPAALSTTGASASSLVNPALDPDKARDGDPSTFFSSGGSQLAATPQQLTVNLSGTQTVRGVQIVPRAGGLGFPVTYTIQTSVDGSTWTNVPGQSYASPTNAGSTSANLAFREPIQASYVRLAASVLSADDYGNFYLQIAELKPTS